MPIRAYRDEDFQACMEIFESNIDPYFSVSEREEFATYIRDNGESYLVLEDSRGIIACGGYAIEKDAGVFCWGMVARQYHGTGLGRELSLARIEHLRQQPGVKRIVLNTSQHTTGFYERFGFKITKVSPDGYGPGLDCCDMEVAVGDLEI